MGIQLGKMRGKIVSTKADALKDLERIDPKFLRAKITPPFRSGGGPPPRPTSAQLAVAAESRGLGGRFREPVRELLVSIGRYR